MKKIALILSITIYGSFFITSCEQPKADPTVLENKIKEAYETKKAEIDAEVTKACEAKINDKVKMLQDSIASLSAAQQATAMAKMQKELAIAQKKASDLAKKNTQNNKKQNNTIKINNSKASQMGNVNIPVSDQDTKNKASQMGGVTIPVTKEDTKDKSSRMGTGN
jgi:hypothetical protein